jgi:hypothetical protein
MPQPTYADLFDNSTTLITAAVWSASPKTLTLTFSQEMTAAQAFAAIVQSGSTWLQSNTDQSVNLASSTPTRNTSSRNGMTKDQINLSLQVYVTAETIQFDATQI